MSDYLRIQTVVQGSENSDYSDYVQQIASVALTPDEWTVSHIVDASTTGETVYLAHLTSCNCCVIYNTSTTATVLATWYSQIGSRTNPGGAGFVIANANPDTITDGTSAGTMITSGAAVGRYVRCASSEDSGNDGLHLIEAASTNAVTVSYAEALTANAADTAMTLSFESKNTVKIPIGGVLVITDTIVPAGNLVLTASASTARCKVSYAGT